MKMVPYCTVTIPTDWPEPMAGTADKSLIASAAGNPSCWKNQQLAIAYGWDG